MSCGLQSSCVFHRNVFAATAGGGQAGGPFRGGGGGGFHDPASVFASFFGTSNPFDVFGSDDEGGGPRIFMSSGGGGMGGLGGDQFPGFGGLGGAFGGMRQGGPGGVPRATRGRPAQPPGPRQLEPISRSLLCTLEELATGTTKRVKVTRQRLGRDGSYRPEEKVLEIVVKPGWKKGTKVTFEREGDEAPDTVAPDIVFIIGVKDHPTFTREGDDLIYVAKLPLVDVLTGTKLELRTLDGRTLSVPIDGPVHPGTVKIIRGEGMPISKSGGTTRGDLHVKIEAVFPRHLSDEKKRALRAALA